MIDAHRVLAVEPFMRIFVAMRSHKAVDVHNAWLTIMPDAQIVLIITVPMMVFSLFAFINLYVRNAPL